MQKMTKYDENSWEDQDKIAQKSPKNEREKVRN